MGTGIDAIWLSEFSVSGLENIFILRVFIIRVLILAHYVHFGRSKDGKKNYLCFTHNTI